ncbi:MAG: ADP-ribosylglycohydrolase family protein [Myxococcota bacterium]
MSPQPDVRDRFRGALLGLASGDAVGTSVEFRPRGSFAAVTDMTGGGPFRLEAGQWTDDTSMALCLGESLLRCGGFDPADQMNRYCRWWREGHWSSNGRCFDIGNTVRGALGRFLETGDAFSGSTHPESAGNGSLMRLAPVPMFFAGRFDEAVRLAGESSRTTHGCDEAVGACRVFAAWLLRALDGASKQEILAPSGDGTGRSLAPAVAAIAAGGWRGKSEADIRGSGYVVHSLEAAVWCFADTGCFRDAVLRASNLGEDADTTAAICGQLAGAFYGESGIPNAWREKLALYARIQEMADELREAGPV